MNYEIKKIRGVIFGRLSAIESIIFLDNKCAAIECLNRG